MRYDVVWKHNGRTCAGGFVCRESAFMWMRLHCGESTAKVTERPVKAWELEWEAGCW